MRLVLGDITKIKADAIVNAASSDLRPCPGICEAIFAAADTEKLRAACRAIGRCRIGHAVVTPAFGLPAKYIIHVAGAGWYGGL
ncbi:MAG: macro domain-containing protein, partial [Ruthenibacterium sp.]